MRFLKDFVRALKGIEPCPATTHEDEQEAFACAQGEPIPRSFCDPYLNLGHFEQAPCSDGLFHPTPHYYRVMKHKEKDGRDECIVAGGRCAVKEN